MPIELDLKREEFERKQRKKDKKSEEPENELPPFSELSHIKVEDVKFVIDLCPGRHNPDSPRKNKIERGADGKIVKPPIPCKNPACNLRTSMIDGMMQRTIEMKAQMIYIAEQLEGVQEERGESEQELETQKQYLRDSEARYELLKLENKECEEELERTKQEEYDGKNRVTELEAERQRLARIVFENKLKQQGIELEGWDGDGLTLNPSQVFDGYPGDYHGEPKDDFEDVSEHQPPIWCRLEHINLSHGTKIPAKSRAAKGVRLHSAMHRPKTCPPSVSRHSATYKLWEAQAHLLPQPSIASSVDEQTIRRHARTDRVAKPRPPSHDARARIAESRERNRQHRSLLSDSISAHSWRSPSPSGRGSVHSFTSPMRSSSVTSMRSNRGGGPRKLAALNS